LITATFDIISCSF